MRCALCLCLVLTGLAGAAQAQDSGDRINPRWKKIEIPTIDPNAGITARMSADQSNYWQTPDPSSINQARRSWNDEPAFGLKLSRPLY